jgi:predicted neutral ceramidase superfamily lipid hydrolase
MAIHLDQPTAHAPNANLRQWWRVVTTVLVIAIFAQAVFAGAMLSGFDWARAAHAANALVVVAATLTAGLVSIATLRRTRNGLKLGLLLLALAAVVFVQFALGRLAAKGANVMWVHVPLGVVLVGLAGQTVAGARRLGEEG